jgi:hypothetical protein
MSDAEETQYVVGNGATVPPEPTFDSVERNEVLTFTGTVSGEAMEPGTVAVILDGALTVKFAQLPVQLFAKFDSFGGF